MEELKGWFLYEGIMTQQHENISPIFKELFNTTNPKQILEIGTAFGGLTLLLRNLLNSMSMENTKFISYDVTEKHSLFEYMETNNNLEVRIENIFGPGYSSILNETEIKNYIQQDGTTIVLCDGGQKKHEFNLLSKLLKPGDIIMAHDYGPNVDYFNNNIVNKIWNWLEIQDSDIEVCCIENNLSPFMSDEFTQVVWVCKIKN
jgi:cephalosporin hydroxylase